METRLVFYITQLHIFVYNELYLEIMWDVYQLCNYLIEDEDKMYRHWFR